MHENSKIRKILAVAGGQVERPMSTKKSQREGEVFMAKMRKKEAESLLKRIEHKELLSSKELQDLLKISSQSISEAVQAGRLFALVGPSGENYYPAFFADEKYDRRSLEGVSQALGELPSAVKFHFFTSKFHSLGNMTPLNALAKGRLAETLVAVKAFVER